MSTTQARLAIEKLLAAEQLDPRAIRNAIAAFDATWRATGAEFFKASATAARVVVDQGKQIEALEAELAKANATIATANEALEKCGPVLLGMRERHYLVACRATVN